MTTTITQNEGTILFKFLTTRLSYSIDNGANWLNVTSFPIIIENSNPGPTNVLSVEFTTDMTFTAVDQYFKCGSEYITFDGKDTTSTFTNVVNCLGLIQNGTSGGADARSNITVQNINVASSVTTTLADDAGWVCQSYFGKGVSDVLIDNCSSSGDVGGGQLVGGICGGYAGYDGTLTISNCYSEGTISGDHAGGICGAYAGYNGGTATISNCYSKGDISGASAGGICGIYAGEFGYATITNSYSSGEISGQYAGGICGSNAGEIGYATITNCYSEGAIGGVDAGGICGRSAGFNGGTATISNCYSLHATGDSNSASGGMIGPGGSATFTNTYGANGTWSSTDANSKLTGTPEITNPGTTWAYYIQDTPYILTVTIIQNAVILFKWVSSTLSYSIDNGANWLNVTSFPILIYNINPGPTNVLSVEFTTDMTFTAVDQYFITKTEYITYDGKDTTSTFSNVVNCLGLIRNGTTGGAANARSNITVQNINVASSGTTTLAADAGWVCQSNFGKGVSDVLIDNCSSLGDISGANAGGICGSYAGRISGGSITISNCYSEGPISGDFAGGICGSYAGYNYGNAIITNCYSEGDIGFNAGGICGAYVGRDAGTATITNCYSEGAIGGVDAGGICGRSAGFNGGTATISNCYSLHATGDSNSASGGMIGPDGSATFTNTYGANGTWSSTDANAKLTGTPTVQNNPGTIWGYYIEDTPYILTAFYIYPFELYPALENVYLGSVTSISDNAFSGCTSLQRFNLPSTVDKIYSPNFFGINTLPGINSQNGGGIFSGPMVFKFKI